MVGVDVSEQMLTAARERCAGLPNVSFRKIGGGNLGGFVDSEFDLVLAADSFPYIVQAGPGPTRAMLAECIRVLRPGGRLAMLNFSYRGDLRADRDEIAGFAAETGLVVVRDGGSEFALWDAAAFVLQKPDPVGSQGSM